MSESYYRGKLYTNSDLKKPFTEAKDDFWEAFDVLRRIADFKSIAEVYVNDTDAETSVCFIVGELIVELRRDGRVEVFAGAA